MLSFNKRKKKKWIAVRPDILVGIVLVLLISASVSTLSSITLTACSTLSMDLVKDRIRPQIKDQNLAMLTRLLCLFFVVGSYLVANYPTPILEMMSYSWGIISAVFSIGDSTANFLPEKLYLDGCIWYNVRRKRMVSARIASVGPYARSGIDSVCLRWMEILPANRECLWNAVPRQIRFKQRYGKGGGKKQKGLFPKDGNREARGTTRYSSNW